MSWDIPARSFPSPTDLTDANRTETAMTDGSLLQWIRSGKTLYVALRGHSLGAVNLAIANGDQLWILHSSAALGSVLYATNDERWTLVHDFNWCCRKSACNTSTQPTASAIHGR